MTEAEAKAVLARLPQEEKLMLQRLPVREAMLILEMHHYFPQATRVDEAELPAEPESSQLSELPGTEWEDIFR